MIRTMILATSVFVFAFVPSLMIASVAAAAEPPQNGRFGDEQSETLKCSSSFLGFPAWFNGLPRKVGTCDVAMSEKTQYNDNEQIEEVTNSETLPSFIFTIVLNVIEIALRLVGFAAVGFIIYGGFKYLTSAGSADRIASGRKIIQNAVIGLVISFFSVAIVNLIASNIN